MWSWWQHKTYLIPTHFLQTVYSPLAQSTASKPWMAKQGTVRLEPQPTAGYCSPILRPSAKHQPKVTPPKACVYHTIPLGDDVYAWATSPGLYLTPWQVRNWPVTSHREYSAPTTVLLILRNRQHIRLNSQPIQVSHKALAMHWLSFCVSVCGTCSKRNGSFRVGFWHTIQITDNDKRNW